jgi:uncharacterized alpha-E superfamily protein
MERADGRDSDVKYFILLPKATDVGSDLDMQHGRKSASVSAHRSIAGSTATAIPALMIAEFLILKEEMCSLVFTYYWTNMALDGLGQLYGKRYDCHDLAQQTYQRLKSGNMEQIFQSGLHEFLQDFITANAALSQSIATNYNFP